MTVYGSRRSSEPCGPATENSEGSDALGGSYGAPRTRSVIHEGERRSVGLGVRKHLKMPVLLSAFARVAPAAVGAGARRDRWDNRAVRVPRVGRRSAAQNPSLCSDSRMPVSL